MLLVYVSRTGNIKRFLLKLPSLEGLFILEITNTDEKMNREYVLLTYTDKLGKIPLIVEDFLQNNAEYLVGVAGSGNRNFGGDNYANAARLISIKHKVPLLMVFELSGNIHDVQKFSDIIQKYL